MELVLASNFDDRLVAGTGDLPVETFFGNFPVTFIGGGRPPRILPPVDLARFREHLAAIHRQGRHFYATLNSNDLALKEYDSTFEAKFLAEVGTLLDLGVDGFVVALPLLVEILRREYPSVPVSVSTFARIRTVTQGEYFLDMGADTIVLEEANRDFALIRGLVQLGARVEILVNQTCIQGCPYRAHHLSTSSLSSQPGAPCPLLEYPLLECGLELVRDPTRLISGIFVRPEDLEVYEEVGVHRFKVSGRNKPTDWLLRAARAYAAREYRGDLLDILSYVQIKGPRSFLHGPTVEPLDHVVSLATAFDQLSEVTIDNQAFPKGFLRRISVTDCEHTSCRSCGWCASVAERVLRIGGKPPSAYVPPANLPSTTWILPEIARAGSPEMGVPLVVGRRG
jgi:collagenase-like PrtC family protease